MATVFAGAVLVFSIQPLVGKVVLPVLGGSPAVWTTAMVFFQAMLLGGYAYAHCLARWLGTQGQVAAHVACIALAGLALPIETTVASRPNGPPAVWLLALLAGTVGAPFFAASATAPLLQRWFAATGHRHAADPYFLYAASNVGSIGVLVAYPFVMEPLLAVRAQAEAWAWGFAALAAGVLGCGLLAARRDRTSAPTRPSRARSRGTTRERMAWLAYSAAPSCLLLGVTGHVATDIASGPLLWVVPLALYLATFVNAFARRPLVGGRAATRAMALAIVLLAVFLPWREPAVVFLPLHLAVFLVVAAACHLELARRRPEAARLTEFYLFVALGGLVGGVGVGLVAPALFDRIAEYPLALVLAAALLPASAKRRPRAADVVVATLVVATVFGGTALADRLGWPQPMVVVVGIQAALAVLVLSRQGRPLGFALGVAAFVAVALVRPWDDGEQVWQGRSFFGVYRVVESPEEGRWMTHGTTRHGGQRSDEHGHLLPAPYYRPGSPVANALQAIRDRRSRLSVGVVGLGTGGLAYHRRPDDRWRYFEIDPLVVWLAVESGHFSMLAGHDPEPTVVLGDARLALADEADSAFDVLVLDAFTSDAVPTHLLTREALGLYLRKTRPDGVVLLHVSNRFLDLAPVLASATADLGVAAALGSRSHGEAREVDPHAAGSDWVAISRDPSVLAGFDGDWNPLRADERSPLWRDDHSSLVPVIRWRGDR